MTKAALPEPVAVVCHGYELFFVGGGPIADLARRLGVKVGDRLITTTQAEAYANAKVQEMLHQEAKPDNIKRAEYYGEGYQAGWMTALKQAARACEDRIGTGDPGVNTRDVDLEAAACAGAVRALLPE